MSIIVGIPACNVEARNHPQHATPARYAAAVWGGAGAVPVVVPPLGAVQIAVLDRLDGLLLPGSPSNVHPSHYDGGASETPEWHDMGRDETTLPLVRAALDRGMPVLAICRGMQELNVALGGTLFQRLHTIPGRMDHRGGEGAMEHRYRHKHSVALDGALAGVIGAREIQVNSLHGQGIDRLAPGLVVEAVAPDGTIEAVRVAGATGFAHAVQWHPEWNYAADAPSVALFQAFGAACRDWAGARDVRAGRLAENAAAV